MAEPTVQTLPEPADGDMGESQMDEFVLGRRAVPRYSRLNMRSWFFLQVAHSHYASGLGISPSSLYLSGTPPMVSTQLRQVERVDLLNAAFNGPETGRPEVRVIGVDSRSSLTTILPPKISPRSDTVVLAAPGARPES